MQKPRIAIDMDDVMAATAKKILKLYNDKFGTTIQDDDFKNKSFHDLVNKDNYLIIRDEIFKKMEADFFQKESSAEELLALNEALLNEKLREMH